jgi:hypothetical protein
MRYYIETKTIKPTRKNRRDSVLLPALIAGGTFTLGGDTSASRVIKDNLDEIKARLANVNPNQILQQIQPTKPALSSWPKIPPTHHRQSALYASPISLLSHLSLFTAFLTTKSAKYAKKCHW